MPSRKQSKGKCNYCGQELAKNGVTKPLLACPQPQASIEKAEHKKAKRETLYHL